MNRQPWLPTVANYILAEFGRALFGTLAAFVLLYLCIDFFERIPRFLEHDPSASQVLTYFLLKIPLIVSQIMPAAVLAAILLGLGALARRAELMAMRACGISLWQIATPLLVATVLLSIGMMAWNEFIVPPSAARSDYIETVEIKKRAHEHRFLRPRDQPDPGTDALRIRRRVSPPAGGIGGDGALAGQQVGGVASLRSRSRRERRCSHGGPGDDRNRPR
jgi:lipopolysaccharide export LptBFGC system permease protein LptF